MDKTSILRIQVLQHEPFEGAGLTEEWAKANGHPLSVIHVYENEALPALETFDWLVIMGGAMSVNDESEYGWLKPEKELIRKAVKTGKIIVGICLGSQLIANALGQKVYPNPAKEIGWFPIFLTSEGLQSDFLAEKWNNQSFFHWHGETFDLPENAINLAYTEGCRKQAFSIGNKVFAFQFHPETNAQTFGQMVNAGGAELIKDKYVMTAAEMKKQHDAMRSTRPLYLEFLDKIAWQSGLG
jgi:GMP synthase-like glutamine amidotransferase